MDLFQVGLAFIVGIPVALFVGFLLFAVAFLFYISCSAFRIGGIYRWNNG